MFRTARSAAAALGFALAAGCNGGDLPGYYFDVRLDGTDDACTGDPADYAESFEYRVELDSNDATLAIGDDVFATGTLEGCLLTYTSLVWTSSRDSAEITWQIFGSARIDLGGGDGCVEQSGSDWDGTEQFVVLSSNAEDVSAGCTYDLALEGTFSREVE